MMGRSRCILRPLDRIVAPSRRASFGRISPLYSLPTLFFPVLLLSTSAKQPLRCCGLCVCVLSLVTLVIPRSLSALATSRSFSIPA